MGSGSGERDADPAFSDQSSPQTRHQGHAGTAPGRPLDPGAELGQGGLARAARTARGSQVRGGSEGRHLLLWFLLFPLFFRGSPLGAASGLMDTARRAREGK